MIELNVIYCLSKNLSSATVSVRIDVSDPRLSLNKMSRFGCVANHPRSKLIQVSSVWAKNVEVRHSQLIDGYSLIFMRMA